MLTRDGKNICLTLKDCSGKAKEIGEKETNLIINTRKVFPKLFFEYLSHAKPFPACLLALSALKSLAKADFSGEKKRLLYYSIGFKPKRLEVEYEGKTIAFDFVEGMEMQLIYQVFSIFVHNSYKFGEEAAPPGVVIDAGANLGVFSIYAAIRGSEKVHAFEPISGTRRILEHYVSLSGLQSRIIIHDCALGSAKGISEIYYGDSGDQSASFYASNKPHHERVEIKPIDELFESEKISFIKIDAEGFEKEILAGARNALSKWKPILSFSAYHKKEDLEELPALVKSARQDYVIEHVNYGEDNLFCH